MTEHTERIPNHILKDIRQNVSRGQPNMTDSQINRKTKKQLFEHWCDWQGLPGWSGMLLSVIEQIYEVDLEGDK